MTSPFTVYDTQGLPIICDTEGCAAAATTIWSGTTGKQTRACQAHNPMSLPSALPMNFTSQTLCHACGQPIRIGATS